MRELNGDDGRHLLVFPWRFERVRGRLVRSVVNAARRIVRVWWQSRFRVADVKQYPARHGNLPRPRNGRITTTARGRHYHERQVLRLEMWVTHLVRLVPRISI